MTEAASQSAPLIKRRDEKKIWSICNQDEINEQSAPLNFLQPFPIFQELKLKLPEYLPFFSQMCL